MFVLLGADPDETQNGAESMGKYGKALDHLIGSAVVAIVHYKHAVKQITNSWRNGGCH